jgi:O-antigen ligase
MSDNIIFSIKTTLPYLRFGIFALSTWYLLDTNNKLLKYFFFCFLFIFLFLELDGIYQFIFKYNLFNYPLVEPYRVSSAFGNELVLGSFLSRNYPLFIGLFLFLIEKKKLSKRITLVSYIVIILLPFLIFMSGERSAFFYLFLASIFIFLFFPKKNVAPLVIFPLFLIIIGIILDKAINKDNRRFSDRIINQTLFQLKDTKDSSEKFNIFSITHEEHYRSAFKIFKDHIIFGAGPKSFRLKCSEQKYLVSNRSCISHPHNTYMQLLSETGILGFFFVFLIFMILCRISFIMFYNKYFLGSYLSPFKICLFASFFITLWPLVPSGNFFTNWLNAIYYLPVGFFLWTFHNKL